MSPTWYDVLGVDRTADQAEIRAAWRAGIADLDPTERRFRSLNDAAEVLLDPERRAAYDATLPAPEPTPEPTPEPGPEPSAEPGPEGTDPVDEDEPAATTTGPGPGPAASGARDGLTAALVVAAAVAAVLGVLALFVALRPHVDPDQVSEAQTAAEQAVVPVLSYDYRHLDEDEEAASGYLTSGYRDDYEDLFTVIRDNAPASQTVVRVEVVASSIVRTAPGRVDVLLFVNRPTTNKQVTTPLVYRDQVTLSMVETDGTWLVDQVSTTPPAQ